MYRSPSLLFVCCVVISCVHAAKTVQKHDSPINKVHIVFMNHLDVGYSDGIDLDAGFIVQVLNRYMTEYFVRAINTSRTLIQLGYTERFIYTTHPWLVSLYLDCPNITLLGVPLKCPSLAEQNDFRLAVLEGHIAWHASPFNMQTDFIGTYLFDAGLSMAKRLDAMFNIHRSHPTMSQRDVPGITKAVLPSLLMNGIKAISVGVNPGTAPPDVPSPFVWKFRETDPDGLMAFWVKGGYPLNPGPDPAHPGGLARDKCIVADGLDEVLCFAFRTDNTGPPLQIQEVLGYYEILRSEFPGAQLVASTFDNYVEVLETIKQTLPVRTFEIGDTWIQGITSDPKKYSQYRAFVRVWQSCQESGECANDPRVINMARFLVKLPEHTWGSHGVIDYIAWSNEALEAARQTQPYKTNEDTWREQRQFIDLALDALGDHPLRQQVEQEFDYLVAREPDLTGYSEAQVDTDYYCNNGVIIKFASDGSISRLYDPVNQQEWASPTSRLGQLIYDTYVEQDFIDMAKQYNYVSGVGYDKPNMTQNAHPEKRRWEVTVLNLYKNIGLNISSCDFWVKATTKDEQTRTKYGAPRVFYVQYVSDSLMQWVNVTLLMLGKTTTRLPESISFGFSPQSKGQKWYLEKLYQIIDPCDVVLNGSQYVHGISTSVYLVDENYKGLQLYSQDVPLVLIGTTDHIDSPFPVPLQPFPCSSITNISFNLYNNIWNTNYPMWYPYNPEDADFKAEFTILFKPN
ncbi:uncharacterized protein LOC131933931 [Physella acuta]|uniref:uncharacterized protein LOC131933931 n=1 Tax=Physella acuta TaxID=109671 RepID=UPI0027DE524D|nr:uncharacterized protein LOC131933931 [Physella acuta]